nr:immunoglobulin light chain junction region [Macaca mulatta]
DYYCLIWHNNALLF